jgi:hypothetical protein
MSMSSPVASRAFFGDQELDGVEPMAGGPII